MVDRTNSPAADSMVDGFAACSTMVTYVERKRTTSSSPGRNVPSVSTFGLCKAREILPGKPA